jgi:hypothetical protein
MTNQTFYTRLFSRIIGHSFIPHTLAILILLLLARPMLTVWAEPEGTTDASMSTTEVTITETSSPEVSDRESRLRNMEDELLKQLSVGNQEAAQEPSGPSLADIKQVSAQVSAPKTLNSKPAVAKPAVATTTSHTKPSVRQEIPREEGAKVPVVSYEDIPATAPREPRSASVVSASAKSSPQRKTPLKKQTKTESLSAKDLEHRLAIAETQLHLVTQELETAKAKLAISEARVRELTDQIAEDSRVSSSTSELSDGVEARAVAVRVSDPDTRPRIDSEVARITKNKAPLRIGPGSRESIITHLSRDNIVSIEHRTSGWYRVLTSDGARGWIPGSYLVFDTNMYSDSTVHVGAFQPGLEPTSGRY